MLENPKKISCEKLLEIAYLKKRKMDKLTLKFQFGWGVVKLHNILEKFLHFIESNTKIKKFSTKLLKTSQNLFEILEKNQKNIIVIL